MKDSAHKTNNKLKRKQYSNMEKLKLIQDYDKLKYILKTAEKYNFPEKTLRDQMNYRHDTENYFTSCSLNPGVKKKKSFSF